MNTVIKGLAAAGLSACISTAAAAETLNFGIISTESSQNLKTVWQPFLDAMEAETGLDVKPFFASDYAGVIEGMRFGKVDVAWFGNKSAMQAVDRAKGEVFAQTVDRDGNPGYWSLLITHVDSQLAKVDDVLACDKSLNFGLGDPNSTSGFLVPTTFVFAERGIDPKDCYKRVTNSNHETNALAVANKQVDFATNNTENLRRLAKTNPKARENVKVIWQSPLIPSDPIVYRKNLPEEMRMRLKAFFLAYGRLGTDVENEKEILAGLQWAPFRDSSDAQLYPIRQLQLFRDKLKLEADERLDADEKAKKVGEIEAELATLKVLAGATATD